MTAYYQLSDALVKGDTLASGQSLRRRVKIVMWTACRLPAWRMNSSRAADLAVSTGEHFR